VKCSFLEIYNEEMEDLLSEKTHMKKGGKEATAAKMRLIDHETRGAICHGLLEQPVTFCFVLIFVCRKGSTPGAGRGRGGGSSPPKLPALLVRRAEPSTVGWVAADLQSLATQTSLKIG
jgi:hypothetical protein